MPKYDGIVDLYRGELPRAVVNGFIAAESNFDPKAINPKTDLPGGGPKIGLLQPSQAGLRELGTEASGADLKSPVDNVRIGTALLLRYLQRLRGDFPGAFDRPLEQDANALAILAHAYNSGYEPTAAMMRRTKTTSYRTLASQDPQDLLISRRWSDRVLEAARKYGYPQVLPAGALAPASATTPGGAPSSTPAAPAPSSSTWPWLLGGAAVLGGAVFLLSKKKGRA